ncbi:MAG: shikimate kinase [Gammaproteobacteria bacterium]|nr:shikimate kinase [Gammaproteobacteria bacterium]MCH9715854.1 shikimate kinase [Gammaproteobacteria bacterium]MCH9763352.1 shikimate kinase [Gammaproteobacteria bacterium]
MTITLCGYKSSGKSTVAAAYSRLFSYDLIDTDDLITQDYFAHHGQQQTISQIYNRLGAVAFRALEVKLIQRIQPTTKTIIATGGGAVLEKNTVAHLKSLGKIIYLQVEYNTLYERLLAADTLPRFINQDNKTSDLKHYLRSRDTIYSNISDIIIDTSNRTIEDIASSIHQLYNNRHSHGE